MEFIAEKGRKRSVRRNYTALGFRIKMAQTKVLNTEWPTKYSRTTLAPRKVSNTDDV